MFFLLWNLCWWSDLKKRKKKKVWINNGSSNRRNDHCSKQAVRFDRNQEAELLVRKKIKEISLNDSSTKRRRLLCCVLPVLVRHNYLLILIQTKPQVAMSLICCMLLHKRKAKIYESEKWPKKKVFKKFAHKIPRLVCHCLKLLLQNGFVSLCRYTHAWIIRYCPTFVNRLDLYKSAATAKSLMAFSIIFRGSELSDVSIIRRLKGVEVLALRWVDKFFHWRSMTFSCVLRTREKSSAMRLGSHQRATLTLFSSFAVSIFTCVNVTHTLKKLEEGFHFAMTN